MAFGIYHPVMNDPVLIATAGHVDHGKSTLVRCLTGIDPDRWQEEKARGITIDLGFAHCRHQGRDYSFVDVPGHEKFLHNMLAGIGSIDGVLFVIAADESIMPQTREHALALRHLGVDQVHLVLTKVDLVESDLLELLDLEIEEWLRECGWSHAEKVFFSSKRPETHSAVLDLLARFQKKDPGFGKGFRLSIDRVFTSHGSGTVVTGTIDRGELNLEDTVYLGPRGLSARVRQLQVHGDPANRVGPHTRAALNLGGVHYRDLCRGHTVYKDIQPQPAKKILVRISCFERDWRPSARHHFHFHHLAAKTMARLLWREADVAVLELTEAHEFWALDKGLIRDGNPLRVCAGIEVLLPRLTHTRRGRIRGMIASLPKAISLEAWQWWFLETRNGPVSAEDLRRNCGEPLFPPLRERVVDIGDGFLITRKKLEEAYAEFLEKIEECHRETPHFTNLPLSRVHGAFPSSYHRTPLFEYLRAKAQAQHHIHMENDRIRIGGYCPRWTTRQLNALADLIYAGPDRSRPDRSRPEAVRPEPLRIVDLRNLPKARSEYADMIHLLTWERFLVSLTPEILIDHRFLNEISRTLFQKFRETGFTVQELKSEFGFTRKLAIPLLEYFDRNGYTRREQESRVWLGNQAPQITCTWQPPTHPSAVGRGVPGDLPIDSGNSIC